MNVLSKMSVNAIATLLLVLPMLIAGGCGKGDAKPRGKVALEITYGGAPVTGAQVSLQSTSNGEGGGGTLNAEGVAEIPAVVEGTYIVTVTPPIEIIVPQAPGVAAPAPKEYANIPEKFRRMETSTLKAEISDTENFYAFDLKK